jgi:hypothetical protein
MLQGTGDPATPYAGAQDAHKLLQPGPVGSAAVPDDRRDADLLGEHGHAGWPQDADLVRSHEPDPGIGRHQRRPGRDHDGLHGPDLTGRAPLRPQQRPQGLDLGSLPDHR